MPPERPALAANFTIAVIGAGAAGADLAWLAVNAGFRTIVEDVFPSNLRNLSRRLPEELHPDAIQRLHFATSIEEAVREADLALDSVPDELESKLEIFSLLDRMAPPRTIFCSPMTETSISDLQSCTYRADRCIAMRKPPRESWRGTPAITLLRGPATSDQAAQTAEAVWRRMGKQVTVASEQAVS